MESQVGGRARSIRWLREHTHATSYQNLVIKSPLHYLAAWFMSKIAVVHRGRGRRGRRTGTVHSPVNDTRSMESGCLPHTTSQIKSWQTSDLNRKGKTVTLKVKQNQKAKPHNKQTNKKLKKRCKDSLNTRSTTSKGNPLTDITDIENSYT